MGSVRDFDTTRDTLQLDSYLRQRLEPKPGDPLYLHLSDLRRALVEFETSEALALLDYGCGGSPYQSLFPNATYHRADFVNVEGLDFRTDAEGRLPDARTGSYDLLLSTQVLEHVETPQVYLAEALRVLKPGGRLLLTTHGVFPDHGCPYDFWRWTADGLRLELARAGFEVETQYRLTAGPRAVMCWVGQFASTYELPTRALPRLTVRFLRRVFRWYRPFFDRLIDRWFAAYAVCTDRSEDVIDFSIGLLALARKPPATRGNT